VEVFQVAAGGVVEGNWGGEKVKRKLSESGQILREASDRVRFVKVVRSVPQDKVRQATELLRLLIAGRKIISPRPDGKPQFWWEEE
jgi:hypothetical protein